MKRVATYIAAVLFACFALGVTLVVVNDHESASARERRCDDLNPWERLDEDC